MQLQEVNNVLTANLHCCLHRMDCMQWSASFFSSNGSSSEVVLLMCCSGCLACGVNEDCLTESSEDAQCVPRIGRQHKLHCE